MRVEAKPLGGQIRAASNFQSSGSVRLRFQINFQHVALGLPQIRFADCRNRARALAASSFIGRVAVQVRHESLNLIHQELAPPASCLSYLQVS
jgi:hypothetical protein